MIFTLKFFIHSLMWGISFFNAGDFVPAPLIEKTLNTI